jgi:hypothetical protein
MKRNIKDGNSRGFTATLNGKLQGDIVAASEEDGIIELFVHDKFGQKIPNSDLPYGYETIEVKGIVSILQDPEPAAQPAQGCFDYMNPEGCFC